ncbi:alpha/beta hydrolase [Terriglobus albidus]|uniref:Alpha/beta hydrolase n=1 Tax=Terriglobus albidus TaxID=1592106 RepID=A0A5B9EJ64_9BACT|nr:alpha/beta hydrolase [Terriglobus albidus]
MRMMSLFCFCLLTAVPANAQSTPDTSPHAVQFVTVETDTKLEVLDWGGHGRPLVLLAGKGFTAHAFDTFASKLTSGYHVYGITRRGYGKSSVSPPMDENYSAARLGKDVLSVIEQLHLKRPVLAGHSIAGEELSYVGDNAPDSVAGLVYLDAAYAYAFYDPSIGDLTIDYNTLRQQLEQFTALKPMKERKQLLHEIAEGLPRFEKDLAPYRERMEAIPDNAPGPPDTPAVHVDIAIFRGEQKFKGVKCPVLAIYADPHSFGGQFKSNPDALKAAQAKDHMETSAQADAFQRGTPQATVLRIANADHFVFQSNEAEVLQAMNTFIASLPQ